MSKYSKIKCDKCNIDISSNSFRRHYTVCTGLKYSKKKEKPTAICITCRKSFYRKRKSKYCSTECSKEYYKSPEYRKKCSDGRKEFLKNNPDKHPWKKPDNHKSAPCEKIKTYLKSKNIKFVSEWEPLEERFFSIDIAFPDIKLGIEINGNQHYNRDGTLKPYYQDRHDLIAAAGWKLLEIHYSACYNIEKIKSIFEIGEQPDYSEFFKIQEDKKLKRIPKEKVPQGVTNRKRSDLKWEPFKNMVITSGIDFTKFGWVGQVSHILNISSQKVNAWMKRYLPDIYEKSFKKKMSLTSFYAPIVQ